MLILSFKGGHDGTLAAIDNGKLLFSLEAEKDSFPRYDRITPELVTLAAQRLDRIPDAIAISGWVKGFHSVERQTEAGYYGWDKSGVRHRSQNFMGKEVTVFSSTHERSHILGAYGMSPYSQGEPVYCLVWEGNIGDFYEIDADVVVHHIGRVLTDPGNKYSSLFMIGDPGFPPIKGHFRYEDAGKLMALAAYSDRAPASADEKKLIDTILGADGLLLGRPKDSYDWSPFYNVGVASTAFKNLAGKFSDELFERFHTFARQHLTKGYPLLISGGCGLNCDWNTSWEESGLFESVFVPPCPNDSGSAIGTAIDAQHFLTGDAKIEWSVYAGDEFQEDVAGVPDGFSEYPLDLGALAQFIESGNVVAWVQGRYEIGPRALGHRSILAAPFSVETTTRLNRIKNREDYRPIAPLCLEEDAAALFGRERPSPYMLHFSRVRDESLKAITHVDGSARVQTVSRGSTPELYDLLKAFKQQTGYGVLCNTSLNFNGRGFINRTSDLAEYCRDRELDGFVVNDRFYLAQGRAFGTLRSTALDATAAVAA
ncbi:proline dehydrogenase [Burkholderia sp. SRS-W-2-2016]|uniref:carbamoyltransferase C-terminal domain-containing protein n=1 Tax=Burkholderia sp. SRS-W-2-2016 TaxID=1926878 RepID=UPI00094B2D62|nr:carbamoyltransferase C-terminal domain-containing protein [Burkholderia sp. SRS-W-2-2016]OLL30995.1 proline dehydrogenase [Burkholderia sp. SRS-W-2-2016]